MAGVTIDSGPLSPTADLFLVPQAKWEELIRIRKTFLKRHLEYDCRCLVRFVDEAERMFQPLGFQSADDLIRDGLGLIPDEIRVAVDWLKINPPGEAVSLNRVLGKHGWDRRSEKAKDQVGNANLVSTKGTTRAYILARLDRDRPDLAAKVRAKTMSANAAAVEAGFRKKTKRRCPHCGFEW